MSTTVDEETVANCAVISESELLEDLEDELLKDWTIPQLLEALGADSAWGRDRKVRAVYTYCDHLTAQPLASAVPAVIQVLDAVDPRTLDHVVCAAFLFITYPWTMQPDISEAFRQARARLRGRLQAADCMPGLLGSWAY